MGTATRRRQALRMNAFAWLLLLPSLIFLLLFTLYPVFGSLKLSLYQADLGTPKPYYTGLDNYVNMAEDEVFWKVLTNNLWFALGTVPTSILIALWMAIFANKVKRARGLVRTAFFYPTVIPMIAIGNIWLFIYTPDYGMIARALEGLGIEGPNWLGTQSLVMIAMIIMVLWKEAGYFMVFFLAGLQNISEELYESAKVDGVPAWRVFWRITFPLLMPTTLFVSIIALTNSFKLVDHLWIMTKGGPENASNLLLYYIFETAFSFWDRGMASALTTVMIVLLLLLAALQFFGLDRKIHYR